MFTFSSAGLAVYGQNVFLQNILVGVGDLFTPGVDHAAGEKSWLGYHRQAGFQLQTRSSKFVFLPDCLLFLILKVTALLR